MSLRYFIHMLFKRKWFILVALIAAPLIAMLILLFVEPVYVSRCKMEIHDRSNPNDPMAEAKSTIKDDVFIQRQIESIMTDRVLGMVIDKAGLLPTPPSQSLWAKMSGAKPEPSKYTPERERIELIRALRNGHVRADETNSVVLTLTVQMNTPELAKKTCVALFEAYTEEFERLQGQGKKIEEILQARVKAINEMIADCDREMAEFNTKHPLVPSPGNDKLPLPSLDQPKGIGPLIGQEKAGGNDKEPFVDNANQNSPIQTLMIAIAQLEIQLIDIKAHYSEDNFRYKTIVGQIEENKKLLANYMTKLSDHEVQSVKYSGLVWRRQTLRDSYSKVNEELTRYKTTIAAQQDWKNTIKVQDDPTYDPQPIFPKKGLILIASVFIGLILGLAMAYIAHVLDSTYHLPEDFTADTGIPVLASLPLMKA